MTVPDEETLMNLYWNVWPAASLTVYVHNGLELVYCDADSAGAEEVSQFPSAAIDPAILIVSP